MRKRVAVAATFTSPFFLMPQAVPAHFTDDDTIQKGSHHTDVRILQSILKETGDYPVLRPTGYFGKTTEEAVKAFQRNHGLSADGKAGKKTKQAMTHRAHSQMRLMARGSTGRNVRHLQEDLKRIGYYGGSIDGRFGKRTELSVRTLQAETHIRVDGIVGPRTWQNIEKVMREGRPERSAQTEAGTENTRVKAAPEKTKEKQGEVKKPDSEKAAKEQPARTKRAKVKPAPAKSVKEFYANSTAYTAYCQGCSGTTATGLNLRENPGAKVVAVDPSVIPLGTKLHVEGYGYAVAADTGGAIKGRRIDVLFRSNEEALEWGRRTVKVKVLD